MAKQITHQQVTDAVAALTAYAKRENVFQQLAAEFPRAMVSWRAQNITSGDNPKALALAYIDARDVMKRLDAVVGPSNWEDSYEETAKGRVICKLRLCIDGEWVSKSDGAGDTDVESEKGALSDAFKRAAVKWGIGRYLYDLETPWVPCETREHGGKKLFSKFKDDPWQHVKAAPKPPVEKALFSTPQDRKSFADQCLGQIEAATTTKELNNVKAGHLAMWNAMGESKDPADPSTWDLIKASYNAKLDFLKVKAPAAPTTVDAAKQSASLPASVANDTIPF
jgi:hypothetical protein